MARLIADPAFHRVIYKKVNQALQESLAGFALAAQYEGEVLLAYATVCSCLTYGVAFAH